MRAAATPPDCTSCWSGSRRCWSPTPPGPASPRVKDVRLWSGPEGTRLVLDLERRPSSTTSSRSTTRIASSSTSPTPNSRRRKALPNGQGPVKKVRSGPQPGHGLRLVLDLDSAAATSSFIVGPGRRGRPPARRRIAWRRRRRVGAALAAARPARSRSRRRHGNDVLSRRPPSTAVAAGAAGHRQRRRGRSEPRRQPGQVAGVRRQGSRPRHRHRRRSRRPGSRLRIGRGGTREKDVTLAIATRARRSDRRAKKACARC